MIEPDRKLIGVYRGQEVFVDEKAHTVYTGDLGLAQRAWWEFNGNFQRWVQARVSWDIKTEEVGA